MNFFSFNYRKKKKHNYLLHRNVRQLLSVLMNYNLSFLFPQEPRELCFLFCKILKWFERSEGSWAQFSIISIEVITAFLSLGKRGSSWRLRDSEYSIGKLFTKTKAVRLSACNEMTGLLLFLNVR